MVSEPSIHGISSKKMVWATHGGSRCGQCLDQYRGGVHGGGARHLFDEMPSHREATPGGVLRVTVSHVLYPVNEEVLHQVFDAYGAGQVVVLERADHVEALVRFRSSRDAERARDVTHGRCVYDGCCWLDVQYMTPSDSIVATPATFSTLGLSHNTDVSMAATTSAAVTLTTSTTSAAATTTFLVTGAREAPRDELKELDPEETSKEPKVTVQELCKKIIATLNSMIESGHDVNLDTSSSVVEPTSHYVVSLPTPPATGKWNDIIVSSPVPPVTADSVRDRPEHSDDHKVFEQILDKSTVVLWPPTIRMTERQPGTPPVQVEVVREGAELRLTLGLAFICYQGDSQLKQPWPPPPFHVEQQKLLSGCVSKVPVRSRNKIVLLKKQAVFILDDLLLEQLFEKQSQQPLFAWYSLARTTFLSQAKLKEIYNIIGVQKISKADSKDECNNIQLDSVTTVRTGRMPLAFEVNALVLAASCLQMFLQELPDELVVSLLLSATEQQQLFMVGHASFLLYCLLSEVAMNIDPRTETIVCLSEKLIQLAVTPTQKQIAFHQLGCIRLLSKECNEAEHQFEVAFSAGHGYSMAGLARIAGIKGKKVLAYEKLSSVITSSVPLGWMHLVRILHDGKSLGQLQKLLFMSSIEIKPWPPPLLKRIEVIRVAQQKQGFLPDARAYWVTRSLIAWEVSDRETSLCLYASRDATMRMSNGVIEGYDSKVELQPEHAGLPAGVTQKFPFISSYRAFRVPSSVDVAGLAKCQLAVSSFDADGKHQDVTGLQLPDVLDDMFAYTGPLGAVFGEEAVSLYLWAPTAQDVSVCFYDGPVGALLETLQLKELNGVGSVTGPKDWENRYYLYEVKVYHPSTSQIEKCLADDPYARGVSANGSRTWLVDIDSETLKPTSWDELADEKPNLDSFSDISIYELHIRDFSAHDSTMDCNSQGGFRAFTCQDSAGIHHLRKLSDAGLTHVHLLPSFHFGGVDDNKNNWKHVDEAELAKLPPGSDMQQAAVVAIQEEDPYNWGYNPVLWGVPKGSYASNPDDPSRIFEYRQMVQALNRLGLRVVMDVVYNHLDSSGPFGITSVLDKIVPGYYLRRDINGQIENSAAMNNTASEHFMVDRLIVDDLLNWAVNYKVDGFRFDLMGHIMKNTMMRAKSALHGLTKDEHGVDGSKIYLYGEGWDFGEVAKNKRGINASQLNMSGTGIGSFNDRIRDAVNGGNPFGNPLLQGFSTGLFLEPNGYYQGNEADTRLTLATYADHIQIGLAGNLRDYVLISHTGEAKKGSQIRTFDGSPVGYTSSPIETINYVSAHDNETLFDIISLKTPIGLSIDERCRINHLASSMMALSQGIPFFHAGDEILRSKSLDRDSYNSGDWFNKLDFTYETNNWGVGLPPREKNEENWYLIKPRLENPSYKPEKNHILAALDNFVDILKIRYSSPLFRLSTASDIEQRVRFHNTGPSLVPGVIVMSIEDARNDRPEMAQLDTNFSYVVTVFNVCPYEVSIDIPALASIGLELHPVQVKSSDALLRQSAYQAATGRFTVPRRTTAVFVEPRR